ncbi:hypothetical protein [Allorhodopirellula solitaria]|nr:hypothetical protein [Allorhodopirellula solitaria]
MKIRFSWFAQCYAFASVFLGTGSLLLAQSPMMIATGWDSPTPSRFHSELAAFEALNVFDGTTISPTRTLSNGRTVPCRNAFVDEPWQWDDFQAELADLLAATPSTATENFVFLYANPGDVDWFDDAAWENVTEHWRLLARLAKQGNLRGILFDAEPYHPPHSQFRYTAQPNAGEYSFEEFVAQSRKRGQQVMRAVTEEYPDITIMSYRLFCDMIPTVQTGDLEQSIQTHTYGLLPGFLDGWLDVAPDTISICEGDEDAYRFNSEAEFNHAYTSIKLQAPRYLSPENQAIFRQIFTVGHGLYLDAHVNPPESSWYIDRDGSTSAGRLRANASAALAASDGYVWLYGERARWWPGGKQTDPTWEEKMPGAIQALRLARDPVGVATERLGSIERDANLLANGDMKNGAVEGLPAQWWAWQEETSHGKFAHQPSQATANGVLSGVLGQTLDVQPGECYLASTQVRSSGNGFACLTIGWKSAEGKWLHRSPHQRFGPTVDNGPGGSHPSDWATAVGWIQVPEDAGQLVFMLSVSGQLSEQDEAAFRDCLLVKQPN